MNLFSIIREQFGQTTVQKVRQLECKSKTLSRYRNHLKYNLRCKDEGVIPASLNIASPVKTQKGMDIIRRAKASLLRERIGQNNGKIKRLQEDITQLKNDLSSLLPSDVNNNVSAMIERSRERVFTEVKDRHVKKLDILINK